MQVRDDGVVKIIDCDSVDDFFAATSPVGEFVNDVSQPIYRGQADSGWGLVPSIFRSGWRKQYQPENWNVENNYLKQIELELELLRGYLHACDAAGLRVEGDSPNFRDECFSYDALCRYFGENTWPPKSIHNLLALAQHYGVATRLLDWSTIPYVAIYFAASDALTALYEQKTEQRLAVWIADADTSGMAVNLDIVRVAGATSVHLAAQSGLFMMPVLNKSNYKADLAIEDLVVDVGALNLKKVTLPIKYASRILELCERFGVSAVKLFPTLDGAGMYVAQKRLIEKLEKND